VCGKRAFVYDRAEGLEPCSEIVARIGPLWHGKEEYVGGEHPRLGEPFEYDFADIITITGRRCAREARKRE